MSQELPGFYSWYWSQTRPISKEGRSSQAEMTLQSKIRGLCFVHLRSVIMGRKGSKNKTMIDLIQFSDGPLHLTVFFLFKAGKTRDN